MSGGHYVARGHDGVSLKFSRVSYKLSRPVPGKDELEGSTERPSKVGDHYEVLRKIGEGSFGVIYLGRTDLASDLIAIKFVSLSLASTHLLLFFGSECVAHRLVHCLPVLPFYPR